MNPKAIFHLFNTKDRLETQIGQVAQTGIRTAHIRLEGSKRLAHHCPVLGDTHKPVDNGDWVICARPPRSGKWIVIGKA